MNKRLFAFIFALMFGLIITFAISVGSSPVASAQGNPWASQFYNSTNFTAPIGGATPSYATLDLTWNGAPTDSVGTPVAGVPADNFSVIFTSTQSFQSGTYRFNVLADDRARVVIDGVEVLGESAFAVPGTEATVGVMIPGGTHTMQVYLIDFTALARIRITWFLESGGGFGGTPGIPATPVPTLVPTRTPLPFIPAGALTATVIRASVLNTRDAPSTGGFRLGRILRGETYAVIGRDQNARWFLLQLGGYQAWAYGYYLYFNFNEFTAPIVSGNTILGLNGLPDTGVRIQTNATMRLRPAPNVFSVQTGRITWGSFLPVVGRTADSTWYQVVWRGTVGWIFAGFSDLLAGCLCDVPVTG